jgi:hypothetical protein
MCRLVVQKLTAKCKTVSMLTNSVCTWLQKQSYTITRLDRPLGFQKAEAPRISTQSPRYGGKVVSPTHRPPLPPGMIPGTYFCYRLSRPQGPSAAGRTESIKSPNDPIGNFCLSVLLLCADCPGCAFCPYCTTHNTNIHAHGGIRTRNPNKRSALDRSATGIGRNRTHDLPTCIAVPYQTAPSRTPRK